MPEMCGCHNQLQPHEATASCDASLAHDLARILILDALEGREIHDRELDELREQHWRDHGGEA